MISARDPIPRGTAVSDAGLRHLEGMAGLERLSLQDCPNVTEAGVARLRQALPRCRIMTDAPDGGER